MLMFGCIAAPWTHMFLYGKYVVAEPKRPEIIKESFPFMLVYKLKGIVHDKFGII